MKKFEKSILLTVRLGNLLGWVSGLMVALMMALVIYEVFMRYIFNRPPILADELGAYLLVGISYLGLAYTFMAGGHVRITFLVDKLKPRFAAWLRLSTLAVSEVFIVGMCIACYQYLSFSMMINERSASWLNFPLKYPQSTLLVGFIAYGFVILGEILKAGLSLKRSENGHSG